MNLFIKNKVDYYLSIKFNFFIFHVFLTILKYHHCFQIRFHKVFILTILNLILKLILFPLCVRLNFYILLIYPHHIKLI